ncbi:MAG: hypothetical protein SGILL_003406 [Bacillariaceae sp.]
MRLLAAFFLLFFSAEALMTKSATISVKTTASQFTATTTTSHFSAPVEQQEKDDVWQDPDAPEVKVEGAEFFGGNKRKEEFYDPIAEVEAAEEVKEQQVTSVSRFFADATEQAPSLAYDTVEVALLARALQRQINKMLYEKDVQSPSSSLELDWDTQLASWNTPVSKSAQGDSPLAELQLAKDFYKKVDLAIVGGKKVSDTIVELSWELALVWPTFWAPRVRLTGTSTLTLKEAISKDGSITVTKQSDSVFGCPNNNLLPLLGSQIKPRFWDWYHIGMSPTTELMPRETVKKGKISVHTVPSQLVLAPTVVETGTRETRSAQTIPNHAFTTIIKTMGPQKQEYTPCSPVQVQIGRRKSGDGSDDRLELSWSIPLSVEFQAANENLLLPGDNPEDAKDSFPTRDYKLQPVRQVATIAYGGNAQDEEITNIRKQLYEQVLKEGLKPKLDENGRPQFFFWMNDVKACYTEEGLGMTIYEWRPKFANSNEVGIELIRD